MNTAVPPEEVASRICADKAAVAHVRTSGADSNNVVGRGNAVAGAKAYGRVVTAGGVASRRK